MLFDPPERTFHTRDIYNSPLSLSESLPSPLFSFGCKNDVDVCVDKRTPGYAPGLYIWTSLSYCSITGKEKMQLTRLGFEPENLIRIDLVHSFGVCFTKTKNKKNQTQKIPWYKRYIYGIFSFCLRHLCWKVTSFYYPTLLLSLSNTNIRGQQPYLSSIHCTHNLIFVLYMDDFHSCFSVEIAALADLCPFQPPPPLS